MQGGPSLDELRKAIVVSFNRADIVTLGRLFNQLPSPLRRPVEILGLLHLASRVDALRDDTGTEIFEAIRPDNETRRFLVPAVALTAAEVAALKGVNLEGLADE